MGFLHQSFRPVVVLVQRWPGSAADRLKEEEKPSEKKTTSNEPGQLSNKVFRAQVMHAQNDSRDFIEAGKSID